MDKVKAPLLVPAQGFRGEDVLVSWRVSELVTRVNGAQYPPSALEHPSLTTLAPTLAVSPRLANGIVLEGLRPAGPSWRLVEQTLIQALDEGSPPLEIHLDPLGEHGTSGWECDRTLGVGIYDPARIDGEDEERCIAAARVAVSRAAGPSSILLMPELAATPPVLAAIRAQLAAERDAPVLTVVGLYHLPADADPGLASLAGGEELSDHVNEAVVLGPRGDVLWRHRKLTCAEGTMRKDEPKLAEDIRLGDRLTVVPTPLGNLAVVICLDSFAPHVRDRLAKSPANVLLIPSLSPGVHRHRDSLQHLVQLLWAAAFVCNRSPHVDDEGVGAWNAAANRSFWTLQRNAPALLEEKQTGEYPSFVFKLDGAGTENDQ
jgi:predicted amidohydrolase